MTKIPISVLELATVVKGGNFKTAIENTVRVAQNAEELGIKWRTMNACTLVRDIKQATRCRSANHYRKIQQEQKEKEEAKEAQEKEVPVEGAVEEALKAL